MTDWHLGLCSTVALAGCGQAQGWRGWAVPAWVDGEGLHGLPQPCVRRPLTWVEDCQPPTLPPRPVAEQRDEIWGLHAPPPDCRLRTTPTGPSQSHDPVPVPVRLGRVTAPGVLDRARPEHRGQQSSPASLVRSTASVSGLASLCLR